MEQKNRKGGHCELRRSRLPQEVFLHGGENEDGHIEGRGTVNNAREEVQRFLGPYRPGVAVLEATRTWGLIYDWLGEILSDVALAHPLKVKAIAEARIKTDKISADILADLLRAGLLLRAYAPAYWVT